MHLRPTQKRVATVVCLVAATCLPVAAERSRDVDRTERLAGERTVEVDVISGSISAVPAEGRSVVVHAHVTTTFDDPGPVIRVERQRDRLVVCDVLPSDDRARCSDRHRSMMADQRFDVAVRVEIPEGVRVVVRAVNASVDVRRFRSAVEAESVNGAISIDTSGTARATSVNGPIDARFSPSGDTRFSAVNGAIRLELPQNVHAVIDAKTLTGDIAGDGVTFDQRSGGFVGKTARATLGHGGSTVRVDNVNGEIRIVRR